MLVESKNLIFRGAPGTGKSYLAKEIATDIISNGYFDDYTLLSDDQKKQVEFVQFHPSYDYTDFVEGLRPKENEDGTKGLHSLRHTFATNLVNGIKQPDGTIKSLTPRQVADLLGHTTSEITEMYYVKRDLTKLEGVTDGFEF